jgi:hypothetical protein
MPRQEEDNKTGTRPTEKDGGQTCPYLRTSRPANAAKRSEKLTQISSSVHAVHFVSHLSSLQSAIPSTVAAFVPLAMRSGPTFQPLAPAGTVPCRKSLRPASGVGTSREGGKAIGNSLCRGQCCLHHLFVVPDFTLHARSLRPQCFLHFLKFGDQPADLVDRA